MNSAEEPDGREHEGDEYVTYNRRRGSRNMHDYDLMLRASRGGGEPTLLFCGFLEETTTLDRFRC
jgi:hypothetical protein